MSAEETIARVSLVESEIQALLRATQDLVKVARQHEGRIATLERSFQQLVELQVRADERADMADELARTSDERMRKFDARLDKFFETVERQIIGRNSNGDGSGGEGNS